MIWSLRKGQEEDDMEPAEGQEEDDMEPAEGQEEDDMEPCGSAGGRRNGGPERCGKRKETAERRRGIPG